MIIFKKVLPLMAFVKKQQNEHRSTGFIPTMGALHDGHISLINACKHDNNLSICSIFINPTQFNNADDFAKYPVTTEADIDRLEANGCDVLFLPDVHEIYPPDNVVTIYKLDYLETLLEGQFRPGHYQGVCQVVDRLMTIIQPQAIYLGQKDYQQCMVIKKMLQLRHFNTVVHIGKTIREKTGLAMSSRNARLTESERLQAVNIFEALSFIKNGIKAGNLNDIKKSASDFLTQHGFKVDYIQIANAEDLHLISNWNGTTPVVILAAAYLNDVRLIDNLMLND